MRERVLPTLTKRGWLVDSPEEKMDMLLAYYFETLPSQSFFKDNNEVSIQELLSKYNNQPSLFIDALTKQLERRFRLYFDRVFVEVLYADNDTSDISGKVMLDVDITVTENEETFTVRRTLSGIKSVFKMVIKEVNYGK